MLKQKIALLLGIAVCGWLVAETPSTIVVEPLCKATEAWNQTGALNASIHMDMGYPCGCDPLAWGQIATYHGLNGYPTTDWVPTTVTQKVYLYYADGSLWKEDERTTSGEAYDWEDARDQGDTVSRLMYDFGIIGHTAYTPGGTMGTLGRKGISSYLNYKGVGWCYTKPIYNDGTNQVLQSDWSTVVEALVRGSLHAGAPLEISIATSQGGHAIICDGYGYAADGTLLFHFHYGWGTGSDNWKPLSWFSQTTSDDFQTLNANVHPEDLGCVLAGRVTQGGIGVANATVTLSSGLTTTTNAVGSYCFTGLTPSTTYTVTATLPSATTQTQTHTTGVFIDDDLRGAAQTEWENTHGKEEFYWVPLQTGNVIADFAFAAPDLFITPSGTGDGTSWTSPAPLSNATLSDLPLGTTVYVASGTYTIQEMLTLPEGVTLKGGYNPTSSERNPYGSPTHLILKAATNGTIPSFIFDLADSAIVDGCYLENNETYSNGHIRGGTIRNTLFLGSMYVIAQSSTLSCCIVRNKDATLESCSLIHCTFYGAVPTDKEGGTRAGNTENVATDFPSATTIGKCTCGTCPTYALNGRALQNTWGALCDQAPGYALRIE